MNAPITKQQIRSAVEIVAAVSEAIRKAGEIPSGHLYAMLVGVVDLGQYQRIVSILKGAGLVDEKANVLRWVGPVIAEGSS